MRVLGRKSIASLIKVALDAVWWLAAVSLALLFLLFVFSFFVEPHSNNLTMNLPVAMRVDGPAHTINPAIPTDAQIEKVRGTLRFPVRKGMFFSGSLAIVIALFAFLLWVLTQLRHVFRSLSAGQPFNAENAVRIRRVGFAVILGELARCGIVYFWSYYMSTHFTANGLRFVASADLNLAAILHGLAILVIAEVFREGVRLAEDQSLTI